MPASLEPLAVIARINAAWRAGNAAAAAELFHEDVVLVTPAGDRVVGRAAMVETYADFAASSVVDECVESEHREERFGDTAIVAYRWRMAWRSSGERYHGSGRDLFVLARGAGGWQVVWRTLLPDVDDQ